MSKTYNTPAAFQTALNQQAKAIVKQQGGTVAAVMRGFYFQRLTARVFQHDPQGWLLKGGQALLVRYPGAARLSKDIDLQRLDGTSSTREALEVLVQAAAVDLGDFHRFVPGRLGAHSTEHGGVDQAFDVLLGTRKVDTVHVDLVVRRNITATPQAVQLRPRPELPWPTDWPTVRLYPLVDHIADKICAMYEWHGTTPSNRYRDLADLLLISRREHLDAAEAHHALHTEAALRRSGGGPELRLPARFEVPHHDWESGYVRAAADVAGLEGNITWKEAVAAAGAFLSPLLGAPFAGCWNPERGEWVRG